MAIINEIKTEEEEAKFMSESERFHANVALERRKYEPTTKEKIFAMMKSLLLRALVMAFLFWIFRRKTQLQPVEKSEL